MAAYLKEQEETSGTFNTAWETNLGQEAPLARGHSLRGTPLSERPIAMLSLLPLILY